MALPKISKKTMNMAYGLGAAVVIIGALMKITHFSIDAIGLTGNLMLTIGLVTEALIFALSAFDADLAKEDVVYKWENVYPGLIDGPVVDGPVTSPAGELQKQIGDMLKKAKVDVPLFETLASSIKDMAASAKSGANTADELAKINKEFAENANNLQKQMGALASNLESLNSVYGGVLSAMNKK
tara:strand:+ start:128 stop:679 length:552 start_codon:yes stop_codon:yes gene_type:complete